MNLSRGWRWASVAGGLVLSSLTMSSCVWNNMPGNEFGNNNGSYIKASYYIDVNNSGFEPPAGQSSPTYTVPADQTIVVRNFSRENVSVTADNGSFNTGIIPAGGSAAFKVSQPGTYQFSSDGNSYFHGTLDVTASGS